MRRSKRPNVVIVQNYRTKKALTEAVKGQPIPCQWRGQGRIVGPDLVIEGVQAVIVECKAVPHVRSFEAPIDVMLYGPHKRKGKHRWSAKVRIANGLITEILE